MADPRGLAGFVPAYSSVRTRLIHARKAPHGLMSNGTPLLKKQSQPGSLNIGSHNNLVMNKVDEASKRPCRGYEGVAKSEHYSKFGGHEPVPATGTSPTVSRSRGFPSSLPCTSITGQLSTTVATTTQEIVKADGNDARSTGLFEHGVGHPKLYLADRASPAWVASAASG